MPLGVCIRGVVLNPHAQPLPTALFLMQGLYWFQANTFEDTKLMDEASMVDKKTRLNGQLVKRYKPVPTTPHAADPGSSHPKKNGDVFLLCKKVVKTNHELNLHNPDEHYTSQQHS